ncbi:NAD(+)/NADH kinase [Actinocrispum sp. NPDC049592]|uniref:NAD(+)/NADH kinase n=1 Tax=Actinocrispum sp. NPDC049592 TaxID=3154835 RepID=UPI0034477819
MLVIRAIGIVLHPQRNCANVIDTITGWAKARDTEIIGLADEIAGRTNGQVRPVNEVELGEQADLVVSLGGDGTMLRALRMCIDRRTPVLGVNLGRLGFLAEVDIPELGDALSAIDEHRFTVEPRTGLCAVIDGDEFIAFNDVALVRVPGHGMTEVLLHVEGHPFVEYAADAVVVATPTGSTAYNFAAGGPIVSPRAEGLLVTPAAPHSAFNRALFLSHGEKLALEVMPGSGEVAVEADGRLVGQVRPGTMIELLALPGAARVVRLGRTTFYQRTQRKFQLIGTVRTDES